MLVKLVIFILHYDHFVCLFQMPLGYLNHWNALFITLTHTIICKLIHKMFYENNFTKLGKTQISFYTLVLLHLTGHRKHTYRIICVNQILSLFLSLFTTA